MAAYDIPEVEADDQDRAEVMDETNLTRDGRDIANFDEIPEVYDATIALGDEDEEDVARDAADFGADDESEDIDDRLDDDLENRTRDGFDDAGDTRISLQAEEEGAGQAADAEHVEGGEDDFTDFEAKRLSDGDLKELGYADTSEGSGAGPDDIEDETDPEEEKRLEEGLKETFPASDPVSAKHIT